MYLKALEIQGFKSFPEKTRLVFEKEITAIVGPNGSGKSNISDALLWVMGEQRSRALRGGKMEDVIFGGTQKRSPLGFAQVSLILDNSNGLLEIDEPEVTITRRYYRNGDSEYYVNREQCRLKDITGMLMDTGLGRDGYSVIGQGRISEIVSAKSSDRRELFEEAAGIARFRYRKEEAERKLSHTQENLTRINDKIDELEIQVAPLEAQAETAKKYLLLRDELRGLEISVWMHILDSLNAQAQQVAADYENAKSALETVQKELADIYSQTEGCKEKMQECDIRTDALRQKLSSGEAMSGECASTIAVLRANLEHNKENIIRIETEIGAQAGKGEDLKRQIIESEERIAAIDKDRAQSLLEIREYTRKSEENASAQDEISQGLSSLVAKENELGEALAGTMTRLAMLKDMGEGLASRQTVIDEDIKSAQEKHSDLAKSLENAVSAHKAAKEKYDEVQNVIGGHRLLMAGREKKVEELSASLTALTVEGRSTESRIKMLSDMEREFEGLGKAVKTVMQAVSHGTIKGVYGPVAGLISTGDKYSVAIETALGAAMQNIVTENQQSAKAAIEMLYRSNSGRATFLPVSTIAPYSIKHDISGEEGFCAVASDIVTYDKKFGGIIKNLLGRTAVVETLADAVRISKKYRNELRMVSLDGQLINAGGSMTGGSTAKNIGILSRSNELKKLRAQHEKLKADHEKTDFELREARRILEGAKYEVEVAASELEGATEALHRAENMVMQMRLMQNALEENLESLEKEKSELSLNIKANADEICVSAKQESEINCALAEVKTEIESQGEGQKAFLAQREEMGQKLSGLRSTVASLEAEREATLRSLQSLKKLLSDISLDDQQRHAGILELEASGADIKAEIAAQSAKLDGYKQSIESIKSDIADINAQRLSIEGSRNAADKKAQGKNNDLLECQQILSRYEQKKLSAELEEKQILDKLWENYELSRTAASAQRQPIENLTSSNRRIGEIKRDIARLGNVNVGAIEEYERVSERYNFLSEQRDDVAKAKRDLEKIIADITGEMEEIFVREFHAIDESFRKVFAELFGGGKASLQLEDEENVLECGIEINVQPPGKAVTTISLLSGGEKAFVAIALYFAIMKVRPTPFCIMDEIEAALDEANVVRFAQYMRSISDNTQFIVITHRRGTMEEADLLYGVTMQEKGVTTVISVDLAQAEKTLH